MVKRQHFNLLTLAALVLGVAAITATAAAQPSAARKTPFDRAFIDAMVPHHRAAITMATAAQKAGLKAAPLNAIAININDTQQPEINQMLRWRKAWYGSGKIDPKGAAALGMSMKEM